MEVSGRRLRLLGLNIPPRTWHRFDYRIGRPVRRKFWWSVNVIAGTLSVISLCCANNSTVQQSDLLVNELFHAFWVLSKTPK
jgi:hypothetical protein